MNSPVNIAIPVIKSTLDECHIDRYSNMNGDIENLISSRSFTACLSDITNYTFFKDENW